MTAVDSRVATVAAGNTGGHARHRAATRTPEGGLIRALAGIGPATGRIPGRRTITALLVAGALAVAGGSAGLVACDGQPRPVPGLARVCDGPGNGTDRCRAPANLPEAIGVHGRLP